MKGMDFSSLERETENDEKPVEVELRQRNGKPYPTTTDGKTVAVFVLGEYSKAFRAAERQITDEIIHSKKADYGADDAELAGLKKIAAAVQGWRGITSGDAELPCTSENVLKLLRRAPWVAKQIETAVKKHDSFFDDTSTS